MSTTRRYHHTYEEYMDLAKQSPLRLEFSEGEIFPLASASAQHTALLGQLLAACATLPAEHTLLPASVKVRIEATDLTTYPDLTLVRGPALPSAKDPNAISNPAVVVEVTSPATEEFDRGDKLSQYKQLPSLEAVVLISHRRKQVIVARLREGVWTEQDFRSGESFALVDGVTLDVDPLYAGIDA